MQHSGSLGRMFGSVGSIEAGLTRHVVPSYAGSNGISKMTNDRNAHIVESLETMLHGVLDRYGYLTPGDWTIQGNTVTAGFVTRDGVKMRARFSIMPHYDDVEVIRV